MVDGEQSYEMMNLFKWHDLGFVSFNVSWKKKTGILTLTDGEEVFDYHLSGMKSVNYSHESPWGESDQIASASLKGDSKSGGYLLKIEMSTGDEMFFRFFDHDILAE